LVWTIELESEAPVEVEAGPVGGLQITEDTVLVGLSEDAPE
jgi:hypothetical protein